MKLICIAKTKKTFISFLTFLFLCNFLPSLAESNFQPPILSSTDIAFNGPVHAIVKDEMTGIVYVGGQFTKVGQNSGSGVPIDIVAGKVQTEFPKVNGVIYTVISDGLGGWYIGGQFTSVGKEIRNNLAHIFSDGTVNPIWNPNVNATVNALAIKDSTIYVGGDFTKIGETQRNYLAAIGTDGTLLNWNPDVKGSFYTHISLIAIKDSTIYIGGYFDKIDGIQRNNLAAVSTDGTLQDWNPNVSGAVYALAIKDSTIYVGGDFTTIGETQRNHLAAIGTGGTLQDWNPNVYGAVYTLAIKDSTIYVGGNFTKIGETQRNYLAAIGTDGTLQDWNPDVNGDYPVVVNALVIKDSTIYVGGSFSEIGGVEKKSLAAIGTDGTVQSLNLDIDASYVDPYVKSIAINGSTVYVGGYFTRIGVVERIDLAAIGADGTLLDWSPSVGNDYDNYVNALAIKDSTIYVGGYFTTVRGITRNGLAAIGTDGTLLDWNPNVSGGINALLVDGSTIYVGGVFNKIGEIKRKNLVAIGTDGTLLDWNPNVKSEVKAIATKDSTIYVGGKFTTKSGKFTKIGRKKRNFSLAAIGIDGTIKYLIPNVYGNVYAIAIKDSTIYVGGDFLEIGGMERFSLAAIGTDGTLLDWNPNRPDSPFGGLIPIGSIFAIATKDSTVYVGGVGDTVTNQEGEADISGLTAIGTDGAIKNWKPDIKNVYDRSWVFALTISGSMIYIGGDFISIDNEPRANFASFSIPAE